MDNRKLARVVAVLNAAVAVVLLAAGAIALARLIGADWVAGAKLIAWALVVVPPLVLGAGAAGLWLGGEWGRRCTVGYAIFGVLAHSAGLVVYYVNSVHPVLAGRADAAAQAGAALLLAAAALVTFVYDCFLLGAFLRTKIGVIARRELASVFTSPLAYIVGFGFLLLVGVLFILDFKPGLEASMRKPFMNLVTALVLAIPLLTMPLFSEEYSRGTIETMMTAPVSEVDLTLGKFLGVLGFYVVLVLATLPHFVLLAVFGEPEIGQAVMGYFGMLLVGAMFIAVGLFFSSLTRHQLLAALVSVLVLAAFTLLPRLLDRQLSGQANTIMRYVSVSANFDEFAMGFIDTRPLVFFLSVTAFFLFLSVKVVESRRWR